MNRLDAIEKTQLRNNIPRFQPGDTVRVHVRIKESENKERLQAFEGIVIARKHGGARETITVRKTSFGVGVERIFPLHATIVDHIDVVKKGHVRRAKLYYLRNLRGKAARIRERDTRQSAEIAEAAAVGSFASRWPNFKVKRTLPHTPLVRIPITLSAELRKDPVDALHVQYTAP